MRSRSTRSLPADLVAAAVPIAILIAGAWILSGPPTRLAFRFYDDAYYYFGVARHLAEGSGSTFDGINPTNGYHPLWCWLLVPVLAVFDDPDSGVRAAGALWFLTAAASAAAFAWALRPRAGASGAAIAAAVFALHPFLGLALGRPNGLETPLYALAIALAIGAFERSAGSLSSKRLVVPAILAGMAALARLDGAFLAVAAAFLLMVADRGGRRGLGRAAVVGLVSATLVLPFLAWGTLRFGSPLPVSGRSLALAAAKERAELGGPTAIAYWKRRAGIALRDIPAVATRMGTERIPGTAPIRRGIRPALIGGLAWVTVVTLAIGKRSRQGSIARDAVVVMALFALLHYAAYALWLWTGGEQRYRLYYFLPQWMAFAAGVGSLFGDGRTSRRAVWIPSAVVLAMAVHLGLAIHVREAEQDVSAQPVSRSFIYGWVRERLPRDAVLGARDAGKLGWFSGRPVVNLDGLINDQRLIEAIRTKTVADYIFDSPIRYLFYDPSFVQPLGSGPGEAIDTSSVAGILLALDGRPDCSVHRFDGDPEGWAVFEIEREGIEPASPIRSRP